MSDFLHELAARRRFGMKPGLAAIRAVCAALGDPHTRVRALHVAGTNGKGAVCAILDSVLRAGGLRVGRYTSPHLVRLNERFFLDGAPLTDAQLERAAARVEDVCSAPGMPHDITFFEALTAVAFEIYASEKLDAVVLETGLGGRLDATNICLPLLTIITRIGCDHCDWLGQTVTEIAREKAGIIKPGVPVILGANEPAVVDVVRRRAEAVGAPFYFAPDLAQESEIPATFALGGRFNRENAVTALAALKVLGRTVFPQAAEASAWTRGCASVVWDGRFQRLGRYLIDGAHNPPAARALVASLDPTEKWTLIAGFCGDKDVDETLQILAPHITRAVAVRTNNPRSLAPDTLAARMQAAGLAATPCATLADALAATANDPRVLICGSLFLVGEALATLKPPTSTPPRFDPNEALKPSFDGNLV